MRRKLYWTNAHDAQIRRRRREGATWDTIAAEMRLSLWAVTARGRRIGASLPPPGYAPPADDPDREPLPSGHPITWNAIVAGTVLDGVPYPLRVFPR